jgi:Rps23 Pro-64 3,4-dihydroxylase Tpa1-like proline 4-hydroxylase
MARTLRADAFMSAIANQVLGTASEYARQFQAADPFRHVVIDDFLETEFAERLRADFPAFEDRHALNEMGHLGGKAVRMDVRDISDSYRDLDRHLQSAEFLDFVSNVTGIPDLLYDPDYLGGGTHENRHGQELDAHVDFNYHPRTKWHRRLNLIIYLNEVWDAAWGGELELHSDPWDAATNRSLSVSPALNRAVVFETTETSWHGFSRIELPEHRRGDSRKSFAIYLYTKERPAQETAPPHATIYVPELMPVAWQVGRNLGEEDIRDLRNRFARLRTQLRYLYDREKKFGAQIAEMEQAIHEYRDSQRIELQGYATQPRPAIGIWMDRWVSDDLTVNLLPTRKVSTLNLVVWAPPQIQGDQELHIELAGKRFVQSLGKGVSTPISLAIKAAKGDEMILRIRATNTWIPAASADSGDARKLSYRLLSACID